MVIIVSFENKGLEQDVYVKLWDVLSHICSHIVSLILFAR